MLQFLPRYLRPRREKIFGPAPEHHLDGDAKARVWAAANAYNAANRQPGQHQGPLTCATLRVLRALLWRFHGADGGGRCFPSYEKIATAAKCCRDTVNVAIKALEEAGILTWVQRITRIRRRERDLLGQVVFVWQVIRTSNGYRFPDPLELQPGRRGYKSENPTGPQNQDSKIKDRPLNGTRGIQAPPAIALRKEHGPPSGVLLSTKERSAIIARQNAGTANRADWDLWNRDLEARICR